MSKQLNILLTEYFQKYGTNRIICPIMQVVNSSDLYKDKFDINNIIKSADDDLYEAILCEHIEREILNSDIDYDDIIDKYFQINHLKDYESTSFVKIDIDKGFAIYYAKIFKLTNKQILAKLSLLSKKIKRIEHTFLNSKIKTLLKLKEEYLIMSLSNLLGLSTNFVKIKVSKHTYKTLHISEVELTSTNLTDRLQDLKDINVSCKIIDNCNTDAMFYLRSRGISKEKAAIMIQPNNTSIHYNIVDMINSHKKIKNQISYA